MAGRGHGRCRGGGKAWRGHGIRAVLARMRGLVKLGSSCGVEKLGGGGKKMCTCGGRIEGLGGRIEGLGGQLEGREGSMVVPGRRIGCHGFHIDSQGQLYAPDSEDEGADVEVEDVVVEGGDGVELVADGAPVMEPAASGARAEELAAAEAVIEEPAAVNRALYEDFAPEVQAHLKVVLAGMDPLYHTVFVDMYKVMVPAFFESD
ncbi:unnamed protein product [Urochloa humidicola]